MKNTKVIFLLPSLLLCSCNVSQKISNTKAKQVAEQISNKLEETYPLEMVYREESISSLGIYVEEIVYRATKEDCFYIKLDYYARTGQHDYQKLYVVPHNEYGYVLYNVKFENNETKINVQTMEEIDYRSYASFTNTYLSLYLSYADPVLMIERLDGINFPVTYYSSGSGNLVIEAKQTTIVDKEKYSNTATVKYDNNHFVSLDVNSQSSPDDKDKRAIAMNYSKNIKVELPSDWESYLEK